MTSQPLIRAMGESDPEVISAAFTAIGWDTKPPALYRHYLAQQEEGGSPGSPNGGASSPAM